MPASYALALCVLIALAIAIVVFQQINHRLIYKPTKLDHSPVITFASDIQFEDVWFRAKDGVRLHGWYCQREGNSAVFLICHGNKGNIEARQDTVLFYLAIGLNVFIFDYRGYGRSDGRTTEKGTYLDVEAAWNYLRETQQIPAQNIVLLGRSLGAGIAAHLALHEQPGAVILESTFSSIGDLAAELYPRLHFFFLSRIHYKTIDKIGAFKSPLLLVHSVEDELIGMHHAENLLRQAKKSVRLVQIRGHHRDGFVSSRDIYVPAITDFLHDNGIATNTALSTA